MKVRRWDDILIIAQNSLELVTYDCTKCKVDKNWADYSATHAAKMQVYVAALKELLSKPRKEKTAAVNDGGYSSITGPFVGEQRVPWLPPPIKSLMLRNSAGAGSRSGTD